MSDIHSEMWDATVCITGMWPIPAASPPDGLLSAVEYEDRLPGPLDEMAKKLGSEVYANLRDGDSSEGREAWEELFSDMFFSRVSGFVVSVTTPVQTKTRLGAAYSWGHVHCTTLFAPTFEEAANAAIAWAEEREASDLSKTVETEAK